MVYYRVFDYNSMDRNYYYELQNPDPNKELNSRCFCDIGLPWKETELTMAFPCEHIFHKCCYDKLPEDQKHYCKICDEPIIKMLGFLDEDLHHQRFADMLSMTHYSDMSDNDTSTFIDSIFDVVSAFTKLAFIEDQNDGKKMFEKVFSLNNLTLKVHGMEKVKAEKRKVFIANHVTYFEFLIINYLFNTGFLASGITSDSKIAMHAKKFVPVLIVNRGDKNRKVNIVDQMRDFVKKKGSICLFPEGMMTHPDALCRFRTGAFHVGYPVFGICLRHLDVLSDGDVDSMIYKMGAKRNMTIEVHITGPYYPPFDAEAIEDVRADMARHGKMVLSRVTNRDVKDKTK